MELPHTNAYAAGFEELLERHHEYYDPEVDLLRNTPEPGVDHPTRGSMSYAVSLLDSGGEEHLERACRVIESVLDLQATGEVAYRGLWPRSLESPIADLEYLPVGLAGFVGRHVTYVLYDHAERLPAELRTDLERSLRLTTEYIRHRDVGPDWTNMAVRATYVALAAGQLLADDEITTYGRERLRTLVGYTRYNDGFTEYNSPTYSPLALYDVGMMLRYITDDRDLVAELNDYGWRVIAAHYHPTTGELAGPHARAYSDYNGDAIRSLVFAGTGGEYGLESADRLWDHETPPADLTIVRAVVDCPERHRPEFDADTVSAWTRDRIPAQFPGTSPSVYGGTHPATFHSRPLEARTYRTAAYALGSFTTACLWGQRRGLNCYLGSRESPYHFHVRGFRDGEAYRTAMLTASQYRNHVAAGVSFLTDDPHAESPDVATSASDVVDPVVRFELQGDPEGLAVDVNADGNRLRFRAGENTVTVHLLSAVFGPHDVHLVTTRPDDASSPGTTSVDLRCAPEGERVDLAALDEAAVLFGVDVCSPDADRELTYDCDRTDRVTTVEMADPALPGRVTVPVGPVTFDRYRDAMASY